MQRNYLNIIFILYIYMYILSIIDSEKLKKLKIIDSYCKILFKESYYREWKVFYMSKESNKLWREFYRDQHSMLLTSLFMNVIVLSKLRRLFNSSEREMRLKNSPQLAVRVCSLHCYRRACIRCTRDRTYKYDHFLVD